MTTEKPLLNGINMISSVENEDESFIDQLRRDLEYFTTYVSPSPFDFDGKINWAGRGWFDRIVYGIPVKEQ